MQVSSKDLAGFTALKDSLVRLLLRAKISSGSLPRLWKPNDIMCCLLTVPRN
jgi:hypothetical protein